MSIRVRTQVADTLLTVAAISAIVGAHKYIFGDFPKWKVVRDLPWHLVNPAVAIGVAVGCACLGGLVALSVRIGERSLEPSRAAEQLNGPGARAEMSETRAVPDAPFVKPTREARDIARMYRDARARK